jgi:ribosomal protein S4
VNKPSYIVSLQEEPTLSHSKPIDISVKSEPEKKEEAKKPAEAAVAPAAEPAPEKS